MAAPEPVPEGAAAPGFFSFFLIYVHAHGRGKARPWEPSLVRGWPQATPSLTSPHSHSHPLSNPTGP